MNDKLKIGITCYPSLGGSGVVATELGKLLAEKGHEVHFIANSIPFRLGGTFQKNIFYHEVEVNDYYVFRYPPYDLSLATKMAQVAQMKNLDVLHVHYAVPHAVCAYLAKEMVGDHLKVVTTLHGTDITVLAQDESLKDLIRLAINKSDAVTAVSKDLIRETIDALEITRPIDLTYNFVDKRVYYPRDAAALRRDFAQPHEKIMMHISNFRPVKRVGDVLDIFDRVQQKVPAKLLFVGEGPDLPKIRCKIESLGLQDKVFFLGKQDQIAEVISMADVLLLPSEKESFGLVALEAMACGVPTIGSQAGGVPELVVHGSTGYLAEIGNTEAMADYAVELLSDEAMAERFREACLTRARTVFCDELITRQYEEIYYRVLGREVPDLKPISV
ncbi:N-acetyl-alpha-D-glucosaminyl L-malate synthase BshA [Paenibacillus sp. CMAA1739]|uniref:N-acetyl-alpha-D-glucosaminyl L-malate synthase BshA n=1 Tax=Paenibacillus ottowii TaxID=2315729 RepID=A0ABY3B815_9BACL|nr:MULTISPECIES: N-acetyl-alpha-D-glucosaminyl L-malate synthase BshA [Paenibacillus]MDP1508680.1 N-acetyl-alpha-D-glucosaminyl L-malate synthase BshA [Paenibacillus ottowii]MEC4565197.1 N-acetyl-alpha-D-glucosaminyl L-malate synthase BshA [Paenibacillus sp. CMAA1739]NEU28211.1 N-acetyl-alpha-D-glucosaminyl L-malate synthase BshA [Paenibacillus polymyxa]OBA05766.1 N-acetyl-alpha-D-glucosaminyl L-malate synthase BshA [Paenibacillus polymyxa]TQS00258.1 N-acetyl-alpha-D-glucosaminyl L-malate synt